MNHNSFSIWLVADDLESHQQLFDHLVSNHPIRLVKSLRSLTTLLRLNKKSLPSCLVIASNNCGAMSKVDLDLISSYGIQGCVFGNSTPLSQKNTSLISICNLHEITNWLRAEMFEHAAKGAEIKIGDLRFDQVSNSLVQEGSREKIHLSLIESKILRCLFSRAKEKIILKQELAKDVWCGASVSPRTLDSHISRLRTKLSATEVQIESVYGKGYQLHGF